MDALIVVDVQNECSPQGQRPVHGYQDALAAIRRRVALARENCLPIAWIRHHNQPHEAPRFVPGTWGAALPEGLGPAEGRPEKEFVKELSGAFSGSDVGEWLDEQGVDTVTIVGFFAHMCVSTTAREAMMHGLRVRMDPDGTAAGDIEHPRLGCIGADEVKRVALLQLVDMGAEIADPVPAASLAP